MSAFFGMAFGGGGQLSPEWMRQQLQAQVTKNSIGNRKQGSNAPSAVRVAEKTTAVTGGFEFAFFPVNGRISGYRIYKSLTNDDTIANVINFVPQPPPGTKTKLTYQDISTGSPFYWVQAVGASGKAGIKIPMAGAPAPLPQVTGTGPGSTLPTGLGGGGSGGPTGGGGGIGGGGFIAQI